jgi:cell division protein DivIC
MVFQFSIFHSKIFHSNFYLRPVQSPCMKLPFRIPRVLYNKYLLTTAGFAVWMLFFDRNDLFVQRERRAELKALERSKVYFTQQITEERKFSEELKNNPATIEKFAREQYKMKRDGEDLFLIKRPQPEEND